MSNTNNTAGRDTFNETMRDELGDRNWFDCALEDIDLMFKVHTENGGDIESCAAYLRARLVAFDRAAA